MKSKLLLLLSAIVLIATSASAQWSTSGTSVYYNGGKVGVGTSAPAFPLSVTGTTLSTLALGQTGGGANDKHLVLGYDTTSNFAAIVSVYEGNSLTPLLLNPFGGMEPLKGYAESQADALASRVAREVLAILAPHLRRSVPSW